MTSSMGKSPVANEQLKPLVKNIFDFSAEALGQIRTWLEQNPPAIPVTQIIGFKTQKVLAGICQSGGGVFQGTGFTSVRNSAGNYTVTFTVPQGTQVVVVASPYASAGLIPQIVVATASAFTVNFATSAGVATDTIWTFLAAPPTL